MEQRRNARGRGTGDPREKPPTSGIIWHDSHLQNYVLKKGATVAERLARSSPTNANRFQSPTRSPDFRKWESCRTMPLVGGFSRGSPVSPTPSFRRRSIFTLIALIGPQDLAGPAYLQLFSAIQAEKLCGDKNDTVAYIRYITVTRSALNWLAVFPSCCLYLWEFQLKPYNFICGSEVSMERRRKTRRPTASSGTIPTCENPVTRAGIEPGSPWWEASRLTTQPPRPHVAKKQIAKVWRSQFILISKTTAK
ncbi:hypothetical protein PR048_023538 [Dryococelus australis]|uniref:Uncharacterized protein n=1 Tax=Dryococelus australis TaxID=614101 RepID=A0ABQ9GUD2_9NEOP|nr:hypothetical protein PR048_023538 [Dryococelus australis]